MASNLAYPQTSGDSGQTGSGEVSTSNGQYIAPVIAVMNADASGTYGVLQRAKVTITNIDETFNYILSEAQSARLMNLFRVADADKSGAQYILDSSANVDVSLNLTGSDAENFREMIRQALAAALSTGTHRVVGAGTGTDNRNPSEYLTNQAYLDALKALKFDTLADMLGADDFASFGMVLDMCGGAISLVQKLNLADAAVRKTLYTQLPETNTEKYLAPSGRTDLSNGVFAAENVSVINFLPFVVGDKIVFVFDVTVGKATAKADGTRNDATEGPAISRVTVDGALAPSNTEASSSGAGALGVGALSGNQYEKDKDGNAGALVFSAPTRRRIALALMISRAAASSAVAAPNAALLDNSGEGLIMEFTPQYRGAEASGTIKMDPAPTADHYGLKLAAGILNGATNIKAAVGPVPTSSTTAVAAGLPASAVSMTFDISQGVVSDGSNNIVVTNCGALTGVDAGGVYGRFAFIPNNAYRANEFSIVHKQNNEWELQVNAMRAGVSKGRLVYIENTGTKHEQDITVTTNWP